MAMLNGQTALITGAAGDLGNEMAMHLAREGAQIVMWDVKSETEAQARVERVRAEGSVTYRQVDVRDRAAVDAGIAAVERLDIVCSNAGIVESAPFLEVTQENWQKHLDVNLTGCFNVCQAAARKMVADKTQGRIILTSTWVSSIPWPEISPYTASKAGVDMLTRSMARELARYGIRVNAVAPGIVKAGLAGRQLVEEPQYAARVAKVIPLGEPGTPVEIAQAVVYLASPQTAYMTGSILLLDGGCSLFQFDS
jgi:NAD(P)-dependent dehydrogenase (short-subunit alcohol dehydrogenase family)